MALLAKQYEQLRNGLKNAIDSVSLDTLTTRFLLLFLFLLTIPLLTLIFFTVSLLAAHVNEIGNQQLTLSKNLFDTKVTEYSEKLMLVQDIVRQTVTPSYQELCPELPASPCILIQRNIAILNAENTKLSFAELEKRFPDLTAAYRLPLSQSEFFASWDDQLFLFIKNISHRPEHLDILRGHTIDDNFLKEIYHQQPNLQAETWILKEPLNLQSPHWLARSPKGQEEIPVNMLLSKIKSLPQNQLFTLNLDKDQYRFSQQILYSPNHEKIARIIHIIPLSQGRLLLTNYYAGIYIISVASLIFSVLLAMLAGRRITQPMLKLIQQVNMLSQENVMRNKDEASTLGIYEIQKLGEAFNRLIKRLRQEHKMKDEFVATLTHDLKVPLLAEKQTLAYFKSETYGPLNEEQSEVIEILQSSNQSCLSLVNGLLEVYRYDSGEVSLVFESFNLANLFDETLNEVQALAKEKSITLEIKNDLPTDSANDDPNLVYADRLEIKRMLHNVLSNAIIHTPAHGRIQCRITDTERYGSDTVYKVSSYRYTTLKHSVKLSDRLLVTVQDSGIGFSSDDLPFLFKQFAASRGRNPMSIGLGLYNCYQVIQAHHGALWIESTEGEGAVVGFVLPKNKDTARDRRVYNDRRKPFQD